MSSTPSPSSPPRFPRKRPLALAGAALATAALSLALAQSTGGLKLESGISYSRGDYGLDTDTEVWVAPVNFVHETSNWRVRATVPWLHLSGPAAIVATGGNTAGGPVRPDDASTSGLGDSMLTLTYKGSPASPDSWHTDVSAKVKFPTGDEERGLGTGEFDTYAQLDFYRSINGWTPFLNGGYRWLGDGLYQLDDGFYASGGLLCAVSDSSSVGASVDWRQKIVSGGDDALETTAFYHSRLSPRWTTTIYAQKGFSDASPDFGAGAQFSFGF